MKIILLSFLLSLCTILIGQSNFPDSIFGEKIYNTSELELLTTPDSVSFPYFHVDTISQIPITGWVKIFVEKKFISFYHYKNGLTNGFFVKYEFLNNKYCKVSYGNDYKGWTTETYDYKWKQDSIYLTKAYVRFWTNNYHLRRTVKIKNERIRIIDNYFFYDKNKQKQIKYKIDSLKDTKLGEYYWGSFPNILNENLNPSTYLRFDGVFHDRYVITKSSTVKFDTSARLDPYRNRIDKSISEIDTNYSRDVFIKFYPDNTFKLKSTNKKLVHEFTSWDDVDIVCGTYYLSDFKVCCSMNSEGFQILEIMLFSNTETVLVKYKNYKDGVTYNGTFKFIPD